MNKLKLKTVFYVVACIFIIEITFARGWVQENGKWRFKNSDGTYVTNRMMFSANEKLYLDENGYPATEYLYKDEDGNIYYFDTKGAMSKDKLVEVDYHIKSNFELECAVTYHFGSNGAADYYINKSNNETIMLKDAWIKDANDKWCFKSEDGTVVKNKMLKTRFKTYYVDENGYRVENYLLRDYEGSTYYFNYDGEMVKDVYILVNKSTKTNKKNRWHIFNKN